MVYCAAMKNASIEKKGWADFPSPAYDNGCYITPGRSIPRLKRMLPSLFFYKRIIEIVLFGSRLAKQGRYDDTAWCKSSLDSLLALEEVGGFIEITGVNQLLTFDGPCVFIGNHMSTLETFLLPAIIRPFKPVTFVVKQGLVEYPVFRHIMRSRDPIVVGRTNPREDLKAVLEGGEERLKSGISLVIFPQQPKGGARSVAFDPSSFNTMGVKLAKRAGVPVVPVAVKTDAWGNGRWLRDFGKIDPSKDVHIAFGRPMMINGRGASEHQAIIDFITDRLTEWGGICLNVGQKNSGASCSCDNGLLP